MNVAAGDGASPRIHALVDLAEGVRLLSWLVHCEPARLHTGMALNVRWMPLDGGYQWPAFHPDFPIHDLATDHFAPEETK